MPSTVSRLRSLPRDSFAASFSQSDLDGLSVMPRLLYPGEGRVQSKTQIGAVRLGHGLRRRRSQCFGVSMISVSTPPMSLGWTKKTERPVRADARLAEDARALGLELGLGGVDVGHLEADVMLAAERVLLEELRDRRVFAQRLDQLDLAVGRIDEADAHALRGQVERLAVRLGAEHRRGRARGSARSTASRRRHG